MVNFYVHADSAHHLARHFAGSDVPGSHFDQSVFRSMNDLLNYINSYEPYDVIGQSATKKAYLFRHHEGIEVGTCGIALRNTIPSSDIIRENRDGFQLEIGMVKELPKTNEFCVIATETNQGKSVVTAFPGIYAPPFPAAGQTREEYLRNKIFWNEFILMRKARYNR